MFGGSGQTWGISEYDSRSYGKEYAKYQKDVHNLFSDLATSVRRAALAVRVAYRLENVSVHTAMRLKISFTRAEDSVLLVRRKVRRLYGVGELAVPNPPEPPEASSSLLSGAHLNLANQLNPKPRDPTSFYWQDEPTPDDSAGTFVCQEFRPGAVEAFAYYILPLSKSEEIFRGQASLEVSATNLPAPVIRQVSIERIEQPASWTDPDVLAIFPDELRPLMDSWINSGELS
jgi:hypothetical protein